MKRKSESITTSAFAKHPRLLGTMPPSIKLTLGEEKLKALLLDTAAYIDASKSASTDSTAHNGHNGASSTIANRSTTEEPTVLRWAGGWVRDKLLGGQSVDIDTAINNMTGMDFATHLREYCSDVGRAAKHGVAENDVGNLHKIAQNPDKSKHLETVTTKVFGVDLDFVNLRKETYTADSRNPIMEFGTAEEDAVRRDATVNALFYNLHTGEVEDFVGGLPDLEAKVIKTPMEPLQTFMDDPLRVLRLVRFASRLGFVIDTEVKNVMGEQKVLDTLRVKISRERVGIELEKMLKGKKPVESLRLIDEIGLYDTIFTNPEKSDFTSVSTKNWSLAYETLDGLQNNQHDWQPLADALLRHSGEDQFLAWNLATVIPYFALQSPDPPAPNTRVPIPAATIAAREGFKASNKISALITEASRHYYSIKEMKMALPRKGSWVHRRDRVGLAIREWDAKCGHWRLQVLAAMLFEIMHRQEGWPMDDREAYLKLMVGDWQKLIIHLQSMNIMDAATVKSLVDGGRLSKELGVKPGPWMKSALDVCLGWQFNNPDSTDMEGAIEEVRSRKKELKIPESR